MKLIEIRDDAQIRQPITQKKRWIYSVGAILLALVFHVFFFDSGRYPPYDQLIEVDGEIVFFQNNKKADDYIIVESHDGVQHKLFDRMVGDDSRIVEGLVNKKVIVKYYESEALGLITNRLAEIYVDSDRVLGDYRNVLKRVEEGTGDWFFGSFIWVPTLFFVFITFKRPGQKENN